MTIKSKRAMTNMFVSALILITYFTYIYIFASQKVQTLKSMAILILVFIGIYVVSQIIILILFHICLSIGIKSRELDEDSLNRQISTSMRDDEMDKLISLKSLKFNFISVSIGFMISLVLLIFGRSATVMMQILYSSFVIGSIIASVVSIYFYERGLQND